jgi:hypothetical protein
LSSDGLESTLSFKSIGERLPEDVTQQELENASNIRVEITHKRRVGGMNHIPKVPSGVKLPEANVVPQGSKPARLGLSTW